MCGRDAENKGNNGPRGSRSRNTSRSTNRCKGNRSPATHRHTKLRQRSIFSRNSSPTSKTFLTPEEPEPTRDVLPKNKSKRRSVNGHYRWERANATDNTRWAGTAWKGRWPAKTAL